MTRVRSPVHIGRERELGMLAEALQASIDGTASTVVILGEAGIGKSRLIEEFLRGPTAQAAALGLVGGCLDVGGGAVPFAPYLELLRQLRRVLSASHRALVLDPSADALAPLLPGVETSAAGDEPSLVVSASEETRRARLFGAVLDVLIATAQIQPLVIVIEDLHWADRSSLELTSFLVRNLRAYPVLIVLTTRTEGPANDPGRDELLSMAIRDATNRRIELSPLDRDEVGRQYTEIAGEAVSRGSIDAIHHRSGGNPFLAEELIALAVTGHASGLPPAARDIVLARLAGLGRDAQDLIAAAAIGGFSVEIGTLRDVMALPAGSFGAAMREASRQAIIVRETTPSGASESVAFRHALTRETVLADLLAGERRHLHTRWAQVLERSSDVDTAPASEIARHWDQAERPDLALTWYLREAATASVNLAFHASASAYERALAIMRAAPNAATSGAEPDLAATLGRAAASMRFAGRQLDAVALVDEQLTRIDDSDVPAYATALERLGTYLTEIGDNDGAIVATGRAAAMLRGGPPAERARALISHVITQVHVLRLDGVMPMTEEAIQLARSEGLPAVEAIAWCQRGLIRTWHGDIEGGKLDLDRAWALALESGDPEAILIVALDRPVTDDANGRFDAGLARCLEGIEVIERIGAMGGFEALGLLINAAACATMTGRWPEADDLLERADITDALGRVRHEMAELRARLACGRGDLSDAIGQLARPHMFLGPQTDADHDIIGALVARLDDRPADAVRLALAALGRAAPHGTFLGLRHRGEAASIGIGAACDLAINSRSPEEIEVVRAAVATLASTLDAAAAAHGKALDPVSSAWLVQVGADLGRFEGRSHPDQWHAAVHAWAAVGFVEHEAWARLREAEAIIVARGDRAAARDTLRRAHDIATGLGAAPLTSEIEALARRARLTLDPGGGVIATRVARGQTGLTDRELEVLELIVAGRSNREIGQILFISPKTASVHVSSILGKLGATGRVEATTFALREGLIEK